MSRGRAGRVPLYCVSGAAHVWNHTDWWELRTKHRICGALIGAVASFPRQNDYLGFPMALMPEEAALLVENDICELFEFTNFTTEPTEQARIKAEEAQQRILEEQTEILKRKRIEQLSQKIDLIMAGKKKKMLSRGEQINENTLNKETMLQEEINRLQPLSRAHTLVQLATEHPYPSECKKLSIEELKPSVLSGLGAVRYAVFRDLWQKEHYITSGSNFGGDFLVYPGEPVRFHATFIVRCLPSDETPLAPTEYVALGRLSVAVNKLAVLATLCEDNTVSYQTLQWHETLG